jgi:cyclase
MYNGVIIGRLRPNVQKEEIIKAFQLSDNTELPHLIGVSRRSVFLLGDIYVHLIEAEMPLTDVLHVMKDHPLFIDVKQDLDRCVAPVTPELYPGIAHEIYSWSADEHPAETKKVSK